jgi:hypothetical protein
VFERLEQGASRASDVLWGVVSQQRFVIR